MLVPCFVYIIYVGVFVVLYEGSVCKGKFEFCFPHNFVRRSQIFEMLVSAPHNKYEYILGGRDKHFKDPMHSYQDIRKTIFWCSMFF